MAKRVLLVMQRKIISDSLICQSKNDPRFIFTAEEKYSTAVLTAEACSAEIVVLEIPESGLWSSADKCLSICDVIRNQLPSCKLMIICCENDTNTYRAVIHAKQEQRIDDFLFYDCSINYLLSKLESLSTF